MTATKIRRRYDKAANRIDAHVGRQIRLRRTLLGMSQGMLAAALGITFQQIQKYERGANRVSAGRLYDMGHVLGVPISFFFAGLEEGVGVPQSDNLDLSRQEILQLARRFAAIPSANIRQSLLALTKALGDDHR